MKVKHIIYTLIFIVSSIPLFALSGYWEKMRPELNGDIPSPRFKYYAAPIDERKVLLFNGMGSPTNDTWIYDYDMDKWTKIQCDSFPDTYRVYPNTLPVAKIDNKNVLTIGECVLEERKSYHTYWLFNYDSLNWYMLLVDTFIRPSNLAYISDGLIMNYHDYRLLGKIIYSTWLLNIELKEPITNTIITQTKILDETANGNYGPGIKNDIDFFSGNYDFDYLNETKPILFVPPMDRLSTIGNLFFVYLDTSDWKWKNIERYDKTTTFLERNWHRNLTNNVIIAHYHSDRVTYDDHFQFLYYDTITNTMKIENMEMLNEFPIEYDKSYCHRKMIKIKDKAVMVLAGDYEKSETWVFHLTDTVDLIDADTKEEGHLFYVGNNNYFLTNIENAELYDIMGNLFGIFYDNSVIDLNRYTVGTYLIRYTDLNKKNRTTKIIKQ